MVVTVLDMSAVRSLHQQLEYQAVTDPLTGLLNRRGFYQAAEGALLRNERSDKARALMYMDLDGFKRINDLLGHEAGDKVLRWVGEQLKDCLGNEASCWRAWAAMSSLRCSTGCRTRSRPGGFAEKLLERLSGLQEVDGLAWG